MHKNKSIGLVVAMSSLALLSTANDVLTPASKNETKSSWLVQPIALKNPASVSALSRKMSSITQSTASPMRSVQIPQVRAVSSDTIFFESFEGYNGSSWNWIPEDLGWKKYSKIEDENSSAINQTIGYNPTWSCVTGDGYYYPVATEGESYLMIQYGTSIDDAENNIHITSSEQDEWICSPLDISVESATNKIFFDLGYIPFLMHAYLDDKGEIQFDWNTRSCNLEVYVSTSRRREQSSYEKIWDLDSAIVKNLTNEELSNQEMSFKNMSIDIPEKYVGEDISIAFRYTGKEGTTMLIDAIRVSDNLPLAKYALPEGSFFFGITQEYYEASSVASYALLPAMTPLTFENKSNEDSETFLWKYATADEAEKNSNTRDLTIEGMPGGSVMPSPKLTAYGQNHENSFSWGKNGGNAFFNFGGNTAITYPATETTPSMTALFGAGNYDLNKMYNAPTFGDNNYAIGNGTGYTYTVRGCANYFDKPATPYIFNNMWLSLSAFVANTNAEFKATIYRCDEQGNVTEDTIATATCRANEVLFSQGGYTMPFEFSEEPLVINSAIFIAIDGFDSPNVTTIGAYTQYFDHDNGKGYAYLCFNHEDSYFYRELRGLLRSNSGTGNLCSSLIMSLNACYPFLYAIDNTKDVTLSVDGETKKISMATFADPKEWQITSDAEWLSVDKTVAADYSSCSVDFTAQALAKGADGRVANVTVSAPGCTYAFRAIQGNPSGINDANVQADASASINGNTLTINYNENYTSASVYSSNGALAAKTKLSSTGNQSINLPQGNIFFVKLEGSKTRVLKVIK